MKPNRLDPYRRHLADCPHAGKGRNFTLCGCPIWAYGRIDGAIFRRTLQTTDWPRAERRIELLLNSSGPVQPAAKRSIAAAVESYLADCKTRGVKPGTLRNYTRTLAQLAAFCPGRELARLDVQALTGFCATRKVAPRSLHKEIQHLRSFFSFCADREWIPAGSNPAQRLKAPHFELGATEPFTREETGKLIAACDRIGYGEPGKKTATRQRARAIVYTLLYSGLRLGDASKLRRAQLEPSGHLVLRTEKAGVPVKVLLHPDAAAALTALPAPGGNPTHFFWEGHGRGCARGLWQTIARLGELAGIHAHPHRFRDTFAVELISNGADIRTVQKLLGHRSVRTTEQHYAHFIPAHQKLLDTAAATLDFRLQSEKPLLVAKSSHGKGA